MVQLFLNLMSTDFFHSDRYCKEMQNLLRQLAVSVVLYNVIFFGMILCQMWKEIDWISPEYKIGGSKYLAKAFGSFMITISWYHQICKKEGVKVTSNLLILFSKDTRRCDLNLRKPQQYHCCMIGAFLLKWHIYCIHVKNYFERVLSLLFSSLLNQFVYQNYFSVEALLCFYGSVSASKTFKVDKLYSVCV